jgi:predicted HicB family RNase H-like nuclease
MVKPENQPELEMEPADSFLHIRVSARAKAAWVKAAQRQGVKLSQWVKQQLNAGNAGEG